MISKSEKPWINEIEKYIPGQMKEGYVKLASNENNYGPSPVVTKTIREKAGSICVYPYKDPEVRENIAKYCKCLSENIVTGNGSDEIIDFIFKTFKGPSAGFYPTFSAYRISSQIFNEKYNEIPLNSDFSFDTERFINDERFRQSNLVFLCSPNNPTGGVIEGEDIKKILDDGKITVVDEAYVEFTNKSCTGLVKDYDNLIVLRTFSKAFALAGLRAGYAVADEKLINLLSKVKPPFSVNLLAQETALSALSDIEFMEKNLAKIIKDREILVKKLNEKFRVFPTEANFILIDVSTVSLTADEFFNKLFDEKIIVRKFGKFRGFEGEYIRISVGTTEENERLIEVLDKI
jgi:histidinol-phosphate aminotransferase